MASIVGKVARILNSRDLVFNRGTTSGVEVGMRFVVLDVGGENITDPDTGEVIGSLQKPKVEVEVTQVGDRLAVARTCRFTVENVGGTGSMFAGGEIARMFTPPKYKRNYETLKSEDHDWEPLSEEESIVSVGDPIVQVIAEQDDEVPPGGVIAIEAGPSERTTDDPHESSSE